MQKRKWTDVELEKAVKTSFSIRQVLITLNLIPAGGNYSSIKKAISNLCLDTSHFLGQGSHKGKVFGPKRPLSDYLDNLYPISSFKLKERLIKENIFLKKCNCCLGTTWFGHAIPLELDHIDGNSENNNLQNLRLLCPNCHALTPTYRGKNQRRTRLRSALAF